MSRFKPGFLITFGLMVLVALCVGCQAESTVMIAVSENGSGSVEVSVRLDRAAVDQLGGDLNDAIKADDLRTAGWKVAIDAKPEGFSTVTARKPFRSAKELNAVIAEVSGPQGPLSDWNLRVEHSFGSSSFDLAGKVHLTGSLDQFSDTAVAQALDGNATGRTPQELATAFGENPDALTLQVAVSMPESFESLSGLTAKDLPSEEATSRTFVLGSAKTTDTSLHAIASTRRYLGPGLLIGGILLALGSALVLLPESVDLNRSRFARVFGSSFLVGVLAGLGSAAFLVLLDRTTEIRLDHPWLLWLLPLGGAAWGVIMERYGGRAHHGTRLATAQIHTFDEGVPARMAPLVLVGTLLTHLLGGSAGREGTALQMATGMGDGAASLLRLRHDERRVLLIAALAGGFGSVFGVPYAGVLFAIEIAPASWRVRAEALPASISAAFVGSWVVDLLGVHHRKFAPLEQLAPADLAKIALYAPLFGVCGFLFVRGTEGIRSLLARVTPHRFLRMMIGGGAFAALVLIFGGQRFEGLSLPMLNDAFITPAATWDFAAKAALTALTVGSGFAGGEVTPLFVIGSTLGSTVSRIADGPLRAAAAVGMMATFGAAANAPLACAVMGIELFGLHAVLPMIVGCAIARLCSWHEGLYDHSAALTLTVTGDQ